MERADLLYSGLMFAAGMLSVWTALLLTAGLVALAPSLAKIRTQPLLQSHLQEVAISPIVHSRQPIRPFYQTMVPKNLRPLVPYLKHYRSGLVWGGALRLIQ